MYILLNYLRYTIRGAMYVSVEYYFEKNFFLTNKKNKNKWSVGNRMLEDTMVRNETVIYYIFK